MSCSTFWAVITGYYIAMHMGIITPAAKKSLSGNRATARRWANFLEQQGHEVDVSVEWDQTPYDMMIALHAWRSADAIAAFDRSFPDRPLVVALTGTDLYRFIDSHPEPTLASIHSADQLIVLHDLAYKMVPVEYREKIRVIYQSAKLLPQPPRRSQQNFDVCVVGHLRDEKDPLRAAKAVRNLPENSRIRVLQYGKAHSQAWAELARQEMQINPRYRWFGEVPHWQIRRAYSRCQLMVLSSHMEGGANVVSEAAIAELPVIASDIDGSIGLLGEGYAGYYPVGNTEALRKLLLRSERDTDLMSVLTTQISQKAELFTPERESGSLAGLIRSLL